MQYKIIVDKQPRTNPSSDKRIYTIDIEELRYLGDIYDSLIITKDADYVIRRLSLSEYGVLSVLDKEVIEPIDSINIELFEGDNYIYLADMTGNYIYAEYLLKNEFTDMYVTEAEMNTAIKETYNSIELSVGQKLNGYSTKQETETAIKLATESINLGVDKKLESYSTTEQMNSAINIKAEGIESNVSKTYATKDEVYSSVGTVNLVNNSDFSHQDESGNYDFQNWKLVGENSGTVSIELINNKTWAHLYSGANAGGIFRISQTLKPAKVNEDYALSLKLKNNMDNEDILLGDFSRRNWVDITIYMYKNDGTFISNINKRFDISNSDEEQELYFTFKTVNDENLGYFDFRIGSDGVGNIFDSYITNIQLEIGVMNTEWRPSQTDFYYQVEQYSKVTQTVEELQSEVGKKVNNEELGTKIKQDWESVQIAWNAISEFIKYVNAQMQILDSDKNLLMALNKYGQYFYNMGVYLGKIGTNNLKDYPDVKSLDFDLGPNGKFMTWASQETEGGDNIMKWSYTKSGVPAYDGKEGLHSGADIYTHGFKLFLNEDVNIHGNVFDLQQYQLIFNMLSGMILFGEDASIYCDGPIYADNFTSDGRLKKDIKESEIDAKDIISKIPVREFTWKKDDKNVKAGFIAQELEEIDENFVDKRPIYNEEKEIIDYQYYVNDRPILATLVKLVQEQQEEIDDLKEDVAMLKEILNVKSEKKEKKTKKDKKEPKQYEGKIEKNKFKKAKPMEFIEKRGKNGMTIEKKEVNNGIN